MINPHLPIDKLAALVVSENLEHGYEFKCGNRISSMSPLPTVQWPYAKSDDLTGMKTGDFIVVGYSAWKPRTHQPNNVRWVVKCKCGRYEIRTTKTVKKNHPSNACSECVRLKG